MCARDCARADLREVFKRCDVIATPSCGITAPVIPQSGSVRSNKDFNNVQDTGAIMRYMFLGNLTGVPAVTIPVGLTADKSLPMGLQLQAPWWYEERLLGFAQCLEFLLGDRAVPESYVGSDLLPSPETRA